MKKSVITLVVIALISSVMTFSAEAITYNPSDDSYVCFGHPDTNYGSNPELRIYSDWHWAYIKFDLSALSAASTITSAELNLYKSYHHDDPPTDIYLYRVTEDWNESGITWTGKPSNDPTSITSAPASSEGWVTWTGSNFVDLVQGWVDSTYDNYGVMLKHSTSNNFAFRSKRG